MIKNYLKIAFRNLWRHRVFSFINIMGLTVGMTACFLIFMYIRFELSYDSFHRKGDRIYRVAADIKTPTETINSAGPSWAVPPNIKSEFPETEAVVRIAGESMLMRRGDAKFQEDNTLYADSPFFGYSISRLSKATRKQPSKNNSVSCFPKPPPKNILKIRKALLGKPYC